MGRRKNNPELVQKLIEQLIEQEWTMDQDEFEEKYNSLSKSDKQTVSEVIDDMEDEWADGNTKPECCAACGCPAYPNCMDSCPIFDD